MTTTLTRPRASMPTPASPTSGGGGGGRPANREALALTGRDYISHSQLASFRSCPRKFAFSYVEQAKPAFQASSLLFGSAMHAAFEAHFRAQLEGLKTDAGGLLHVFMDTWQAECEKAGVPGVPIRFNKNEDMSSLTSQAQRMIEAFLVAPLSRPVGQIVGIEESFRVMLDPALPDVLARVDLVTQTPGSLHVVDLKTSRSRWTPERAAEGAEQLLLYGRTIRGMSQAVGLPVQLHFAVLTKNKKPQVQILDVPCDESRLAAVRDTVASVWRAVRSGSGSSSGGGSGGGGGGYFANPSPMHCSLCPFRDRCPAFGGRASVTVPQAIPGTADDLPI